MKIVHPIREKNIIENMKVYLKSRSERDYVLFVAGINTGLRIGDLLRSNCFRRKRHVCHYVREVSIMNVTVGIDDQLLAEVQSRLGNLSNKAPNVLTSALNRTVTSVAASVRKEVRSQYNIKAGDINQTITKVKANRSTLKAIVYSKGTPIPLDRFKISPKTVQPKRKKPIKVGVKKGGLKATVGAFVTEINGIKIFQREGKKGFRLKDYMDLLCLKWLEIRKL